MPDSMSFMIFLPTQRTRGSVQGIPQLKLSVYREFYDIVIYNQSEMQFWHVRQYK